MANAELREAQAIENKKTGKVENTTCVWVQTALLKKSKFEIQKDARSATLSFQTKDTSAAAVQAMERRVRGFVSRPNKSRRLLR